MFHYAIKMNKSYQFVLIAFHQKAERDTFAKYAGFNAVDAKTVNKYISRSIIRKCNCYIRCGFDNGGNFRGKANSLYKPLNEQRIDRPEDGIIPNMPSARRRNIVDATTTMHYTIID